eukprot:scaffold912_cov422-Prasinococcus_capsulatus_cf.AAC.6
MAEPAFIGSSRPSSPRGVVLRAHENQLLAHNWHQGKSRQPLQMVARGQNMGVDNIRSDLSAYTSKSQNMRSCEQRIKQMRCDTQYSFGLRNQAVSTSHSNRSTPIEARNVSEHSISTGIT